MMYQIVFQVTTEIGWRKIHLDSFLGIMLLYEFQRWNKVAVGTDKDDGISSVQNAIGYHSHGNVYIGFLFLRARNRIMSIWTLNLLFKIFATNDFKPFSIKQFVGIEKSTLSATFFRIQGRSGKINNLF